MAISRLHGVVARSLGGCDNWIEWKDESQRADSAGLSGRGAVHKTPGNLNNLIGTPKLFWMEGSEWAGVIEVGMVSRELVA